jgi:hypothetical protein
MLRRVMQAGSILAEKPRSVSTRTGGFAPTGGIFAGQPPGYGFSLPIVYLVWLAIVTFCYFPCKWFAGVKQRNENPWLSYL